MKKSFLAVVLGVTSLTVATLVTSCVTGSEDSKRKGYSSEACREKCERLGQTVAVTPSENAGKCICLAESRRSDRD
jgi:hypothetical protein